MFKWPLTKVFKSTPHANTKQTFVIINGGIITEDIITEDITMPQDKGNIGI
jgi:hypothetical protein